MCSRARSKASPRCHTPTCSYTTGGCAASRRTHSASSTAKYNPYDPQQHGIHGYDVRLNTHVMPVCFKAHWYTSDHTRGHLVATEHTFFIGGKNAQNNRKRYEEMLLLSLRDYSMRKMAFKRAMGSDSKLLLIDDVLHISGDNHNTTRRTSGSSCYTTTDEATCVTSRCRSP